MADDETRKFSVNKVVVAVLLFLVVGLVFNVGLNYVQSSTIQTNSAERAVIGDEILQLNRTQSAEIKLLLEKIDNLNNKIEKLAK